MYLSYRNRTKMKKIIDLPISKTATTTTAETTTAAETSTATPESTSLTPVEEIELGFDFFPDTSEFGRIQFSHQPSSQVGLACVTRWCLL